MALQSSSVAILDPSPKLMRWLTTDPVRALNLYTYNRNNPFRFTDPHGRFAVAFELIVLTFSAIESLIAGSAAGAAAATIYFSPQTLFAAGGIIDIACFIDSKANKFENSYNQIQPKKKRKKKLRKKDKKM